MVRALLIWLLAFALPAQGVMAATRVPCGPDHPEDRASAVAVAHEADAAHRLQDSGGHQRAEATAADEAAAADAFAPSGLQRCSVCATCGAAIHDTVPKRLVVEPAAPGFAALTPSIECFAADGPDRPPRHGLA